MWPIQLAFRLLISCRIFLCSLTLSNTSSFLTWYMNIYTYIHSVVRLTTGPKPLPKRALLIVRSRASSFKWQYHLLSSRSSSSFLRVPPRLPVTSIPLFILPSIARCRRQFLHKIWPIQLAYLLLISFRIFLCSFALNTSSFFSHDRFNWSSPAFSVVMNLLDKIYNVYCFM